MEVCVSDDEENEFDKPEDLLESEDDVVLLPEKSREVYWCVYDAFQKWQEAKKINDISENIMLKYFEELSTKYKPSSLWSKYSMLRSTVNIKHNIKLEDYKQLLAFLKQNSAGYEPKRSKALTPDNIKQFLNTAPNSIYLVTKVALIFGLFGACRNYELVNLTPNDVIDHGEIIKVVLRHTKSKISRSFYIEGELIGLVKRYIALRPQHVTIDRFFLAYKNNKCSNIPLGKNKLGIMCKEIAKFLDLPDFELYTGHTFRRSSASVCADQGFTVAENKLGGWKSTSLPEDSTKQSIPYKRKASQKEMVPITAGTSEVNNTIFVPKTVKSRPKDKQQPKVQKKENNGPTKMETDKQQPKVQKKENNEPKKMETGTSNPTAGSVRPVTHLISLSSLPIFNNILPRLTISQPQSSGSVRIPVLQQILPNTPDLYPPPPSKDTALLCGEHFLTFFKTVLPSEKFNEVRKAIDYCKDYSKTLNQSKVEETQQVKEEIVDEPEDYCNGFTETLNQVFVVENHEEIKEEIEDHNYE